MDLVEGRLEVSLKGFGFVIPDNPDEMDIYVHRDSMNGAMHKDRVVARASQRASDSDRKREGEIVKIVTRANGRIVGRFESTRRYAIVIPDDKRLGTEVYIKKTGFGEAKSGDKVIVEILKWPEKERSAEGTVVEILGQEGDPGLDVLSIIVKHAMPREFPETVEQAAERIPISIAAKELENRRDLRNLTIVTIDGEDAKDLDDAVHIEKRAGGGWILGVHIADVSYYVTEGGPLDKEASLRGTSVYLVDRVIPMLPERLSNGICSLNPREDRLALSATMEIDENGNFVSHELFPSIIRVHTRLSYTIVRKILADKDVQLRQQYEILVQPLEEMERLSAVLRNRRMRRGAIDFDFPEIKVKIDEAGKPIALEKRLRSIAESIIEEFMLAANETVAEHMDKLKIPFVFRVHAEPEPEKMIQLNTLLQNFGQRFAYSGEVHPMTLQKVLTRIAGRPEERIISTVMLRSLKQARYEAENIGHFGLASRFYTHFTSPIRRYPDLIVHRLLRETLAKGGISDKRKQKWLALLPEIATHSSERERSAAEAERESVDLKKVEYMAQFVGQEFPAVISGVTNFGFFAELENGVEGLVHVSSLGDDFYQFSEEQYSLIGQRHKKVFQLGAAVQVRLEKVNPEERTIDFTLIQETKHSRAKEVKTNVRSQTQRNKNRRRK